MPVDIIETFRNLRDSYFRYYDTPFGLANASLEQERRQILDQDNGVYREPYIEIRPEYRSAGRSLEESAALALAPMELSPFIRTGLVPAGRDLYTHQEAALISGVRDKRNVVVTAGTGAGKTEAFLLPLLANLLKESQSWTGHGSTYTEWWRPANGQFVPQRQTEMGRTKAVRAIILYPMNALVDDQLIRLRKALDSDAARKWLDDNRLGHRFYFGRYTGATPVTGRPNQPAPLSNLRSYLQSVDLLSKQAQKLEDESQYFVPRLGGAEMTSRWDMAHAAPDILITNYSMLNVLLLRERDRSYFDSTRAWLQANSEHRFTFVVDELHSYRGTAGTEVALLIRNLKMRLGLHESSDQFQVIAASASLEANRDEAYVEQFFGVDRSTFDFLGGNTIRAQAPTVDISLTAFGHESLNPTKQDLEAAAAALSNVFYTGPSGSEGQKPEAKSLNELQTRLFPSLPEERRSDALKKLLKAALEEGSAEVKWPLLRSHLFFRNVPGMWACTDPNCPEVAPEFSEPRSVGRLYSEPVSRCLCGSRVLEFLYCQNCGDTFLGGYTPTGATQRPGVANTLLADLSDLEHLPDQVSLDRTANNYVLYWPQKRTPDLDNLQWKKDGGKVSYAFRRSILRPETGELRPTQGDDHTGWTFHVEAARGGAANPLGQGYRRDPEQLSPFPTRCPNCADDWEITHTAEGVVAADDKKRQRSPIRAMRTGFEKINQVLITELLQDLEPTNRKTIVFADSRQDAAKLSSGIGLRHYQDLLRLLLNRELSAAADNVSDVQLAKQQIFDGQASPQTREAIKRLKTKDLAAFSLLRDVWEGESEVPEVEAISRMTTPPSLPVLTARVAGRLLELGINPGGPAASLQQSDEKPSVPWSRLYHWEATVEPRTSLSVGQDSLFRRINSSLQKEVIDGLFSGVGRDYESLGLGWLGLLRSANDSPPPSSPSAIAQSSLRILADMKRFEGMRNASKTPPRKLKTFWSAVARKHAMEVDDLHTVVEQAWGSAVTDFLIDPDAVTMHQPSGEAWVCGNCRRQHLIYGCGLCTYCAAELPEAVSPATELDYYGHKATHAQGQFRLTAAELTGQTDRLSAQSRQARFQDVFLTQTENKKSDGIEVLSVTTTMEAGVDIGALDAVVLANMPPTRFNYQQRVGRAGRRSTPMAISLTVCRGRSHDEYYFGRPELITNAPTPKPYLALDRPEIYIRALRSEVLRRAFDDMAGDLATNDDFSELGNNTHGQFGLTDDWTVVEPLLKQWLIRNAAVVEEVIEGLATYSGLGVEGIGKAREAIASLTDDISAIALSGLSGHPDLSQRLAEGGLLPMFGFPSKVRNLYLRKPNSSFPWPPDNVIDRDAAMAASQFAPGSELVRDGEIYSVIGVSSFSPADRSVVTDPNPLGEPHLLDICRRCSFVEEKLSGASLTDKPCPRCGAEPGIFSTVDLREPKGYRADKPRDFDGNFSWSPRSTASRAMADFSKLQHLDFAGSIAYAGRGKRYVINDNSGKSFRFLRAHASDYWGGYVAVGPDGTSVRPADSSEPPVVAALGTIQPTDFLFYGPKTPLVENQGLRLNLSTGSAQPYGPHDTVHGRRAAWYSLSFLMRTVAAAFLDVQPQEFTAGLYTGLQENHPTTFAFLADSLENGAGFSSHLGQADVFPEYLGRISSYLKELSGEHALECSSSCYRCLRDYSNMAYHALLDWRLARDLKDVLEGGRLDVNIPSHQKGIENWAAAYNMKVLEIPLAACALWDTPAEGRIAVVVRHPLESAEHDRMSPRLAEATRELESASMSLDGIVYVDSFSLDRDPSHVINLLRQINYRD